MSTFAALDIGKEMTDAVAEFTARMGAGNEALVAKFTKALTATGGAVSYTHLTLPTLYSV